MVNEMQIRNAASVDGVIVEIPEAEEKRHHCH